MGATTLTGHVLAGRYRLVEVIGQGGMAVVYRAWDELLAREVAVKVLRPAFATDEAFVERFRREARNAAALLHPNIVTIHDTGVDEDAGEFIVMSFVDGPDLQKILARYRVLPVGFVVRLGIETARALQFAHDHGIVHRDIKPGNILIDVDGGARVADFGIARAAADTSATASGTILASAPYASPEQVAGEPVSPRSDIYSLGIVLYEALGGARPFDAPSQAAVALERLRVPPPPLRDLRPELPDNLQAIVMRALERDPQARQPSAAELAGELERFRIAELGGIRRRGIGARAARTGTAAASEAAAIAENWDLWPSDPTTDAPEPAPLDDSDSTERVAVAVPGDRRSVAARAGTRARRRRRAIAPIAIAASLALAALSVVVLVVTANLLGRGLAGGVLGEISSPRASDPVIADAPSLTPSPSASPSPTPTPSPIPTPTASPTPEPTAAPTPQPTAHPTPKPTPRPASGPTAPSRDPAETVRRFYDLVERHEFDAAARLWTRRMREQYPPEGNIDGRFAPTTRIDIDRLSIERMSLRNGTAVVSVAITEYRSSGPSPRRFAGTWELVLTDAGWLMDEPHF
jgi:tRNA A-37 threonylcarbamoyl transferase component Bud32